VLTQVWENDAQAPTRVKCRHAGVTFWAQVYDSDHGGGTIDLHGKGDSEFLQHRALSMHDQAKLQAVVLHVEKEEDFSADFDVAFGRKNTDAFKILKERMAVEALEVRQGSVLGYISSGDYFGESSLIATDAEHPNFRYDRTVTAMTDCDLCYLQRKDMPELMAKYPALEEQLKGFVLMRLRAERSRRLFNEIDRDHSGHLCSDEMNQLLRSLGIEEKSERTQAIEEMDIEGGTTAKPYTRLSSHLAT
jgi:CRP-like cAMP-binding protein